MALTKITNSAIADDIGLGGNPTTSTQTAGDSTTRIATTAFVSTAVANLVDSAPATLNTLNELAAAIGDNATFSSTMTTSIASKLPLAGGTLTGNLNLGDNVGARFGLDSDLQIYHNASHSYIDNAGTGNLYIRNGSKNSIFARAGGEIILYHNDSGKLATTSTGIDVTGNIGVTGTVDGIDIAARDAVLTSTTTTAGAALPKAGGTMTGSLAITTASTADTVTLTRGTTGQNNMLKFKTGSSDKWIVGQRNDSTDHFRFYSYGTSSDVLSIETGGDVVLGQDLRILDGKAARFGTDEDFSIYNDGSNTTLRNSTSNQDIIFLVNDDGAANTEVMRIDASTNRVGIGTDGPASKLHISGNSDTSDEDVMLIIEDVDGSAGSRIPAIMFRSNTGGTVTNQARIRGTDTQGIVMSGSASLGDDLVVQAGGVGIGTSTPTSKLEVLVTQSNTMTDDTAAFAIKGNGGDGILMGQRASTPYAAWIAAGYLPNIGTSHNYPLALQPHGGSVGIGTVSPDSKLHLKDTATNSIVQTKWENDARGYLLGVHGGMSDAFNLYDATASASRFTLLANGNIGIGETVPQEKLEVNGNILLTGSGSLQSGGTNTNMTIGTSVSGSTGLLKLVSTGDIQLFQYGSSWTTNVTFKGDGNIGIGTDNPESLLTIQNDDAGIRLRSNTTTAKGLTLRYNHAGNFGQLLVDHQGNNQLAMKYYALSHSFGRSDSDVNVIMDDSGRLLVGSTTTDASTSERFLVKSTGSEHSRFVNSSDTYSTVYIKNTSTTANTNQPFLTFQDTGGNRGNFGLRYSTAQLFIQGHGGVGIAGGSGFTQDPDLFVNSSGNIGIGTNNPLRSLDVRHSLSIFGTGGYTELMLRSRAGTAQNLGAFHLAIRGDVGGNNDDLKFLRFTGGNSPSYAGIALQIQNSTGNVGIGTSLQMHGCR